MKNLILILTIYLGTFLPTTSFAENRTITWHSVHTLIQEMDVVQQPVLIWVKTTQEKQGVFPKLLKNNVIHQYVQENYYTVLLEVNDKRDYTIHGKIYDFLPYEGCHELAYTWTNGEYLTDALVFLDPHFQVLHKTDRRQDSGKFLRTLQYFNGPHLQVSRSDFLKGEAQKLTDNLPMILRNYKDDFQNIQGPLLSYQRQGDYDCYTRHQSILQIPEAVSSSIIFDSKKNDHYFIAVLEEGLAIEDGEAFLQLWKDKINACDMTSALEAATVNEEAVFHQETSSVKFTPVYPAISYRDIHVSIDMKYNYNDTYSIVLVVGKKTEMDQDIFLMPLFAYND